jgi:hypothetical protein
MSFRTVRHLCGHDVRYRLSGSRSLGEHHLHELERSSCTPCVDAARAARRHIYLGPETRVIDFPTPAAPSTAGGDAAGLPDQRRASASA